MLGSTLRCTLEVYTKYVSFYTAGHISVATVVHIAVHTKYARLYTSWHISVAIV